VITGHVDGSLTDSFAAGVVLGTEQAGGLAGRNYGTITNCYSFGVINSSGYLSGGLVGINGGTIFNSYSQADVQGTDDVGGLAGKNHPQGIIENCYSTGTVNGTTDVGGLLGYNNGGTLASCFWDSDVNPDVNGIGNTTDANVIGETTANMQIESTFTDAGWDFVGEVINGPNDVWTICEGEDYPRLAWEKYGGGNGTEANPYLIRTSCQMNAIGADSNDWDAHFELMADIDLGKYTGDSFNVIGYWQSPSDYRLFNGVFDGAGHAIYNFTYESNGVDNIGLFGYAGDFGPGHAEITNLGLVNPNVNAGSATSVGPLVGRMAEGTISHCYVYGGGAVGDVSVGGLVGGNSGDIVNCYSRIDVSSISGHGPVGGLMGIGYGGSVSNCYSTGKLFGNEGAIGGLVGAGVPNVMNSFWDVNNSDCNSSAGGTGKTTVEMQTESTFTDAGWDFVGEIINGANDIWDICEGMNYPKLTWQIPLLGDFICPDGVNFIDYAFFAEYWLQTIYGDCGGAELTGDGNANYADFALFAEYWMLTACGECGGADFTGDGNVDLADLAVFAEHWLEFEYAEVDLNNDGQVGPDDLLQFAENWLAGK